MNHTVSLSDIGLFIVHDSVSHQDYMGSNQEWYPTKQQKLTGCAPSTASTLLLYDYLKQEIKVSKCNQQCLLSLMEDIWQFMMPKSNGISSTKLFIKGLNTYAISKQKTYQFFNLNISRVSKKRPTLSKLLHFVAQGLHKDVPVAFLNLCNGRESNLEKWHWVTISALEYTIDEKCVWALICDGGIEKKIDLALWLHTTTLGGGFVYFTVQCNNNALTVV